MKLFVEVSLLVVVYTSDASYEGLLVDFCSILQKIRTNSCIDNRKNKLSCETQLSESAEWSVVIISF